MNADDLIAFEEEMAELFNAGEIKAPLHLVGGNETQLIELFAKIRPQDWVCSSWRSHYHCLLKGVPRAEVKQAILEGRSIGLCFPKQRVITSGIVGGIMPIAVGLAWAAKRQNKDERVFCFIGDMTGESGIAHETVKYARHHALPIFFAVEDNGLSVATDTQAVWGIKDNPSPAGSAVVRYSYVLDRPHVGTGKWVSL